MLYDFCFCYSIVLFFFKQKTAYEMRISDWSSDVCSSDLRASSPLPRFLWWGLLPCLFPCLRVLEGFCARNDFNEFSGDRGLTRAIVLDRGLVDQIASVACRIVHRCHRGTLLGCRIFQQRAENLDGHVTRSEEHTSELQSLMRISYAVFCLKK